MADRAPSDPTYQVGYGKPPQRTQFVKGVSGNPKGRPKGVRNFATELREELDTRIPITENGRRRKVTKRKAVAKQLVNKAAAGDPKAIPVLLSEARAFEAGADGNGGQSIALAHEDEMVMESIIRRIREGSPAPDTSAVSDLRDERDSTVDPTNVVEDPQ